MVSQFAMYFSQSRRYCLIVGYETI